MGELVTVVRQQPNGANDTFLATVDASGFWIVQADPDYFASSQNNLTFYISGSVEPVNVITIRNAAYGDVFLCSGQSVRAARCALPPRAPALPPPPQPCASAAPPRSTAAARARRT